MNEVSGEVASTEVFGGVNEVGGGALGSAPATAFTQRLPGAGTGFVVAVDGVAVGGGGAVLLSVWYDFGSVVSLFERHDAGGNHDEACGKARCLGGRMGGGFP